MNLELFKNNSDLHAATKELFKEQFQVKINELPSSMLSVKDYFKDLQHPLFENIQAIFTVGLVNERTFQDERVLTNWQSEIDYQTIFIIAVDLIKALTRSEFVALTRMLNRPANTNDKGNPVIAIFRYGNKITLSSLERQPRDPKDWRDGEKISTTKVSMLKDVDIEKPHAAHLKILKELVEHKANNFDELYKYWQKVLNTKELNNKFYQELFKWYLYAKDNVTFPNDLNEEQEKYISESLIRFISRMLFVWFMKEKKLIPKVLFDSTELKLILKNFDQNSSNNLYYKTILQNLFFATLNVPIEERKWIDGKKRNKAQQGDPLIYRFESEFIQSDVVIENIFMKIPFLNGGLFECLDDRSNNIFVDGFTKNSKKQPQFPDFLFFGEHNSIDLSHHFADDAKEKRKWQNQNITGILDLLNDFKFTVEENTPLEVDVALDPELLGKVFENLLASFNPETKATARKQTGSFYTPREIVNYMVEESLKQHLKTNLPQNEKEIEDLFKNELENINDELKKQMVNKLFDCKILDPACGSGAYPMGVLHKMVELMTLLDNNNSYLKQSEGNKLDGLIENAHKLSDTTTRKQTVEALQKQKEILQKAEYDYVRKLYIIENCIYGVDIQPIAIQISKLRFFISLLVEQNKKEDLDNFGIEPLPNMDFKLVAANTLISPPQEDKGTGLFADQDPFFEDFERLAHDYFTLHNPDEKKSKKQEIVALINNKIAEKKRLIASVKNKQGLEQSVTLWETYQNLFKEKAVSFFETPFFFPKVKDGFDVVIGNPPYGALSSNSEKEYFKKNYVTTKSIKNVQKGSLDTYSLFIELGHKILRKNGNLIYIVPMSINCSDSMTATHNLLESSCSKIKISSFSNRPKPIFENAFVKTAILFFIRDNKKANQILTTKMYRKNDLLTIEQIISNFSFVDSLKYKLKGRYPKISTETEFIILKKLFSNQLNIEKVIQENGRSVFYRAAGGRYYNVVTSYSTNSSAEKVIAVDENYSDFVCAVLSSNLFWWYQQVYTDCLNLKLYEISQFPLPLIDIEIFEEIKNIYAKYLLEIEANAKVRIAKTREKIESFKEYKVRKSKHLIDKIDDLIAPLYGLTKDEIDYIKNYEIEYRISDEE